MKTNLGGPWEFADMKYTQVLILLLNSQAVEGGALPGRYQMTCQLPGLSLPAFTRVPVPDRLLLPSCVTLSLSLALSEPQLSKWG